MKRTHTILTAITLISVILTSACTAGNANSTTSSVPETAVTTTAPAVTGTVIDRIDEPKAESRNDYSSDHRYYSSDHHKAAGNKKC